MPWNGGLTETDSMVSTGKVPWHQEIGIGVKNRADHLLTYEETIELAGLTWTVDKKPVYAGNRGKRIPGYVATVRSDTEEALGVVKDTYRIIQNAEAFGFLNSLVDSGDLEYETAGSLFGGKVIWALAHVPADLDLGDAGHIRPYLLFTNNHDGRGAAKAKRTTERVECANTLDMALRGIGREWSVRHIGDPLRRLEEAREQLQITFQYMEGFEAVAKRLLATRMSKTALEAFTVELIPNPKGADEAVSTRTLNRRTDILGLEANSPDLANVRGTGWSIYNAVAQYADHGVTYRTTKNGTAADNRAAAVISGSAQEVKDRALAILLS